MTQPEFGVRLKEHRLSKGWSQAELGAGSLSASYVSMLESGHRQATGKVAALLAERLGVDVAYLLTGQSRPYRQERDLELRFAELALHGGDPAQARATWERLRATGGPQDPDRWEIDRGLARAHERCGDLEQAVELLEDLRERAEQDPARRPWMEVVIDLSRCYREAGDLTRAVQVAEDAVERARALGLDAAGDFPRLVVTLAGASRERGDHTHASQLLHRLLGALGPDATRRDRGSALWNAAVVAAEKGQYAEGILLAERALAQFAEEEDVRAGGMLRTTLAWILLESPDGDPRQALALLHEAHRRLGEAGMQIEVAYTETELARASALLGDPEQGLRWARSSLARLGDGDRLEAARARLALAWALLVNGEQAAAVGEMTRAADSLALVVAGRQAAAVWRDLAELFDAVGDHAASTAAFGTALDLLGLPRHGDLRTARAAAPQDRVEQPTDR